MESSERQTDAASDGDAVASSSIFPLPNAAGKGPDEKGAKIYLSWGGEVYGPASAEEVISGLRTSWFESGSLYWHEGLEHWNPLAEFPQAGPSSPRSWQRVTAREMPSAPSLPVTQRKTSIKGERRRRQRRSKKRPPGPGAAGRRMIFGFVLLAVLATVLILLLLMLV
jgi:hypothetical protein